LAPFREPPNISFDRIANFRDLGGHRAEGGRRVRSGRLFRSGHLGHASERDVDFLGSLGIRRVFDFRTVTDISKDGADRLPSGTQHLRLPMPDPAMGDDLRALIKASDDAAMEEHFGNGKAAEMMVRSAASLVRERREPYAMFLRELAGEASVPALFHCSAGKDRAGWAGSVVLLALGVSEEEVVEQYLLSNRDIEGTIERLASEDEETWGELLFPLIEVRLEYILASFDAVQEDWGSFDSYLHDGLGVTQAQRQRLRDHLLE